MCLWKAWVKTLSCKLIITPAKQGVMSAIFQDRKPLELSLWSKEDTSCIGNIYIGRVEKIVKNIQGAFLFLEEGKKGYFPLEQKAPVIYTKKGASRNLQQGDELLVQVYKDAFGTKALSLTSEISLSGKYLVAVLGEEELMISRKLKCRDFPFWQEQMEPFLHQGVGWIIRTNAEFAAPELVTEEARQLLDSCVRIRDTAKYRTAGTCLYRTPPEYLRFLKDRRSYELEEILTDSPQLLEELKDYLTQFQPDDLQKLRFYQDPLQPLQKKYPIEAALKEALSPRVWLKSGGTLIIQQTEALVAIDVNSGKYNGKKQAEETFLKINLEAAREAARQIRLRNLSGIIIIDFINMKEPEHSRQLMEALAAFLKEDPVEATLVDMTPLGLVEITRKRERLPLSEIFARSSSNAENFC